METLEHIAKAGKYRTAGIMAAGLLTLTAGAAFADNYAVPKIVSAACLLCGVYGTVYLMDKSAKAAKRQARKASAINALIRYIQSSN